MGSSEKTYSLTFCFSVGSALLMVRVAIGHSYRRETILLEHGTSE